MYYYASKISAIACGTRCRQSVLQKSRGQRDRDKHNQQRHQRQRSRHCGQGSCHGSPNCSGGLRTPGDCTTDTEDDEVDDDTTEGGICIRMHKRNDNHEYGSGGGGGIGGSGGGRIYVTNTNDTGTTETSVSTLVALGSNGGGGGGGVGCHDGIIGGGVGAGSGGSMDGVRYRRRFSEQLDAYDIELGFQKFEVS